MRVHADDTDAECRTAPRTYQQHVKNRKVSLLRSRTPMRADSPSIAAPPFPRNLPWVNVAPLRMDQQRGQRRAGRVLGLLPRQLAAHAAVPEGLARALRRGRTARSIGVHTGGVPARARRGQRAPRGRAARDRVAGRDRHRARGLGHLRQRGLAGALPVGRRAERCSRCTTARAPTRETEREIQELLGVEREPVRAGAPRGRRRTR